MVSVQPLVSALISILAVAGVAGKAPFESAGTPAPQSQSSPFVVTATGPMDLASIPLADFGDAEAR